MEKISQANNQKKADLVLLILDNVDSKARSFSRDKKEHDIIIKESIHHRWQQF